MKEIAVKKIILELEPTEDEAFEIVLDVLERISYLFDENSVDNDNVNIFLNVPQVGEVEIIDGMDQRAIQALEEILGVWK